MDYHEMRKHIIQAAICGDIDPKYVTQEELDHALYKLLEVGFDRCFVRAFDSNPSFTFADHDTLQ